MLFADVALRYTTLGLLFGLAILVARDERQSTSGCLLIGLCISLMALMISWTPAALDVPGPVRFMARIIDMPNTVLAWLFLKSIMDDRFKLDAKHIFAAMLYCAGYAIIWFNHYKVTSIGEPWIAVAVNIYALLLFAHLVYLIIRDWRGDVIEERRKARLAFVVITTCLVSFLILSELTLDSLGRPTLNALKVGVTLLLALSGYVWFLQIRPNHIAFASYTPNSQPLEFSEQEQKIVHALDVELEEKQAWSEPRLTINTLAKRIGVGEHVLRKFINIRLGYRNFSQYLRGYRLAYAKMLLADPAKRDHQILEIALDCGFNSISTFNRVFKEAEGQSPKEFRQQALSNI